MSLRWNDPFRMHVMKTYTYAQKLLHWTLLLASWSCLHKKTHQEMRYPNVTSLYFATPFAFNAPTERFPWNDLRKNLHGGQKMDRVQNGKETLPKVSTPWVGCTKVTDNRQTIDDKRIRDSRHVRVKRCSFVLQSGKGPTVSGQEYCDFNRLFINR